MKEIRFESAFPQVPERVHLRLERALQEKEKEGKNMSARSLKRPALACALALGMLLILSGSAYALASHLGILDFLVQGDENATGALKAAVQPVAATATADNIRIDLTGAVFDGERLALAFTAQNLEPESMALLTLDSVTLNGQNVYANFHSFDGQWLPDIFALEIAGTYSRNPVSGGMLSDRIAGVFSGMISGEATFTVARPRSGKLVIADPELYGDPEMAASDPGELKDQQERLDAILQSGQEILDAAACASQENIDRLAREGRSAVDRSGMLLPYEFSVNMHETAVITVAFTLDADETRASVIRPEMEPVNLPGGAAVLENAFISPLSTLLSLRVYFDGDALPLSFPALTDENGHALAFLDMEYEGMMGARQDADGRWFTDIEWNFPGLAEIPREIRFTFEDEAETEAQAAFQEAFSQSVVIKLR